MLVFILVEQCYQSNESSILSVFLSLADANEAMDKYNDSANLDFNDSANLDYYAFVEEFTCQ